jgi:hypothetical protein
MRVSELDPAMCAPCRLVSGTLAIVLLATLALSIRATVRAAQGPWPDVRPFSATFEVPDGQHPDLKVPIRSADGSRTLYQLECRNWKYEEDRAFSYSGDFECRLSPSYEVTGYSTLLTEEVDATADWQSRARFRVPELRGRCGAYIDYGRKRTFRLRGMLLTIELSAVRFSTSLPSAEPKFPGLASFRVVVEVSRDNKAQTEIAASSLAPVPPDECDVGYRSLTGK